MSVADAGTGAGAEQLSGLNPKIFDKSASKLATHIDGNHFFLTPAGGFVGFTENDKLCFFFFLLFPLPATAENDSEKPQCPSPFY